jgi:exoribonuclease-2
MPLVLPVLGGQGLPRNAKVRIKLGEIDLITLDVHGTVVDRLDTPVEDNAGMDNATQASDDTDDGDDVAGPIAIAVDVNDSPEVAAP